MSLRTLFQKAPNFESWHSHPGKQSQILITAGVDGDEYAGIEAAKNLIKYYSTHTPSLPITIIPIVNLEGYKKKQSTNPLDGRYPKHIFPGLPIGTSSSRLMWELKKHTQNISLWIDLHGGASDEHLPTPFAWADHTQNKLVDVLTTNILSSHFETTLYTRKNLPPSSYLSKNNSSYLLLESGELGHATPSSVNWHVEKVKAIVNTLSAMLSAPKPDSSFTPTYTKITYHTPNSNPLQNILWHSPHIYALGS